jgi:hypothetical protein
MGVGCPPSDSDINRKKMVRAVMTCLQRPVPIRVYLACKQYQPLPLEDLISNEFKLTMAF